MGRMCFWVKSCRKYCVSESAGDYACLGLIVVVTYDHGCAEFCQTNPRAMSILDEVVAGFGSQNVQKHIVFLHGASHYSYVAHAFRATVRADLRPCANLLCFTGQIGHRRLAARSEAIYDTHYVPLCAVFLHQCSRK